MLVMTSICHVAVSNLDHLLSVVRIKERPTLPENLGKTTAQKRFMLYFSENCWNKILIIVLIGLITSRCFWQWACTPVPKRRLVAWVIMGYHIVACLNQVESIIKYFSWRRFQRCFLMWHAIELQCRAF